VGPFFLNGKIGSACGRNPSADSREKDRGFLFTYITGARKKQNNSQSGPQSGGWRPLPDGPGGLGISRIENGSRKGGGDRGPRTWAGDGPVAGTSGGNNGGLEDTGGKNNTNLRGRQGDQAGEKKKKLMYLGAAWLVLRGNGPQRAVKGV